MSDLEHKFSVGVDIVEPGEGITSAQVNEAESIQINNPSLREIVRRYPAKVVRMPQEGPEPLQSINQSIENPMLNGQVPQSPPNFHESEFSIQEQGEEGENEENSHQNVRVDVPNEVLERINSLEAEIDKIKKYVKLSIDSIKATLIDLRSAMAELSNPFNILRKYADIFFGGEEERKEQSSNEPKKTEHQSQPTMPQIIPIVIPSPVPVQGNNYRQNQVLNMAQNNNSIDTMQKTSLDGEEKRENTGASQKQEIIRGISKKMSIDVYEKLVDWANNVLNRIGQEKFSKLIDYYIDIGLIEEDMGNALKKIVEIVNELRTINIDPKEQVELLRELLSGVNGSKPSGGSKEEKNGKEHTLMEEETKEVEEETETSSPSEAAKELLDIIGGGGGS